MPVYLLTPQERSMFAVPHAKAKGVCVCVCVCVKRPTYAGTHGSPRWVCVCTQTHTHFGNKLHLTPSSLFLPMELAVQGLSGRCAET